MALDQSFPDGIYKRLSRRGLTCMSRIDESKTVHMWLSPPPVQIGTGFMAMGSVIGRARPLRIMKFAEMAPK
jgi:hypothetical protein